MEKKTAKQEAIIKAYGEHWDKVKEHVRFDDGTVPTFTYLMAEGHENDTFFWKQLGYSYDDIEDCYGDCEASRWRPKPLQGIEDNNGWNRCDEQLPENKHSWYKIHHLGDNTKFNNRYDWSEVMRYYKSKLITHWKPIKEEPLPIY